MSEYESLRGGAVRALHAVWALCPAQDDSVTRLLSRITCGKSQAGIIADSSYASHVSTIMQLSVVQWYVYLCMTISMRIYLVTININTQVLIYAPLFLESTTVIL